MKTTLAFAFLAFPVSAFAQESSRPPTFAIRASTEPVRDVLKRLFEEAKKPYRIEEGVKGTVSLDADGLTLDEALDRLSKMSRLVTRREGEAYVVSQTQDDGNTPEYFKSRRISETDLAKKKEGRFLTFFPDVSSDPVYGQGLGLRLNFFNNGSKTDKRFAYTPYLSKLTVNAFVTDRDARELTASLDLPYYKESRYRFKVDFKLSDNPNNVYFGITERTLGSLTLPDGRQFSKYDDFERARKETRPGGAGEAAFVTDALSNRFNENEVMLNLKADYAVGDGRRKYMVGYEIQKLGYKTFTGQATSANDPTTGAQQQVPNGTSVLDRDAAAGIAKGTNGGIVSILQQALIYDTRDFEPDPTKGTYFEIANELSLPMIGSQFVFDKLFVQLRNYKKLPMGKRTVLATRVATGNIFGNDAPFFEFQDQWSPDGSVNSLGGSDSLRGFVANRFLARAVFFANAELRIQAAETKLFGQRFDLKLVPFIDIGTVRDNWLDMNLDRMKTSYGMGVRIAWNQSTIINADFGFSSEGRQFFLGIGHPF